MSHTDIRTSATHLWLDDDDIEFRMILRDGDGDPSKPKLQHLQVKADKVANDDLVRTLAEFNADGYHICASINPRKGKMRGNENVLLARCLFADFDGVQDETQVRGKITAAGLPPPTMLVASGHGIHAYWRLTEPMTNLDHWQATMRRLASVLQSDPAVCNPERVMRVPGTVNHKPPTAPCTLIYCHDTSVSLADIEAVLPATLPAEEQPRPGSAVPACEVGELVWRPNGMKASQPIARARAYLAAMPPAISEQGGHNATYTAAVALAHGFCLDEATALDLMLTEYNPRCVPPWTEAELKHKVKDALMKPHDNPRGWLLNAEAQAEEASVHRRLPATPTAITVTARADELGGPPAKPFDVRAPLDLAKRFIEMYYTVGGVRALQFHTSSFWRFEQTRYRELPDADMRTAIYGFLEQLQVQYRDPDSDETVTNGVRATKRLVDDTIDALRAIANPMVQAMPAWVGLPAGTSGPAPANLIAFANGLLDVSAWLANPATPLIPHTPAWFSANSLPHRFDPTATCPTWDAFLLDVFGKDPPGLESVEALGMWFGYNLTTDMAKQKLALFVGPPRAGKGVVCRTLAALLGSWNVAAPRLSSLAGDFGLAPLLGKLAAICPDAHLGRAADSVGVLEVLKSIVGEDILGVNIKFRPQAAAVRLTARFTIAVNELLAFPDASGAMAARVIVWAFHNSFVGREDRDLESKLRAEMPGIANWALAGLRRLRESGALIQPQAGVELLDEFARLASPTRAFVEDCCTLSRSATVPCAKLYSAFRAWCEHHGHRPAAMPVFGAQLRAACPGVRRSRPGVQGGQAGGQASPRPHCYSGIDLKPGAMAALATPGGI